MRRLGFRLLFGMTLLGMPVCAQDIPVVDTDSLATDSLAIDSLNMDPEWYVAPLVREADFAPRRAAAANCPVDSVLTFNVDSILSEVTVYEYGDTTRTMVWTVNADGSRIGKSRTESASTATTSYSATYAWDASSNNWKGTSKEEHTYAGTKETERILYNTWLNNDWLADTKYTWTYDASNREHEYTTYTRNTSTNQLVLSKQRIREYNAAGKTTLDIQYTAHNGTDWSAGTKKVYDFDAAGNQIEYTYYSSLSNGNWVGSTHEVWVYTGGKKTYYEKQTWSNGGWSNSSKEIWAYNGPSAKQTLYEKYTGSGSTWNGSSKEIWEYTTSGKQTLHEKYSWSSSDWSLTLQENSDYDAAGNNTLVENYNVSNGVFTGSKKEEYTYNAQNKKNNTYTYKWTNGAWVYNQWSVSEYDAAGNATETCKYNWKNEAWVGTGTRTLQTFNSNKKVTEKITQSWPTNATDWINKTCTTTVYSGANVTQEEYYTWQNDAWLGTKRSDYHYNASNKNDTTTSYTYSDNEWKYANRTVNTFNAAGTNIMTHNAIWQNNAWVMTSMTRTDLLTDAAGHQLLNASWRCDADSVWIGLQKDTAAYSATGKNIYNARYISWTNNDWVPSFKQTFIYDDADRILLNERYNWSSNQWKGGFRYEYGYDEQGRQNYSATYNSWNTNTGSWVGTSMTETVFNEAGQTLENTLYNWRNNQWTAFNRYLYIYDEGGRLKEQVVQSYSNNEWQNSQRFEKGYLGNQLVVSNEYFWINEVWCITSQSEKTYDDDADAKLRREITGRWNSSTGVMISYADNLYSYSCDPKYYTIRFVNYDGTELSSESIVEGETPSYNGDEPTKQEDAEYSYTFSGWTPSVVPVTGNATYTATFTGTKRSYTITWLNEDGSEIEHETLEYGATPAHANINKESTDEFTYTFAGWKPGIGIVTGDATYTADFDSIKNKYTVIFRNYDEAELQSSEVEYGVMPNFEGEAPTKPADAQDTYNFAGWDPQVVPVIGNATYTAQYTSTVNSYTIKFMNGDTELQSTEVAYGEMPVYGGAKPTKDATAQYTYDFSGWDSEIVAVTGEKTYNATFSSTVNSYVITFMNGEDILQSGEVAYGETPSYTGETPTKPADAQDTYTFLGWSPEIVSVTGTATYTATFIGTTNKYLITFKNGETELQSSEVDYGETPVYTGATPTKAATAQYTYTFSGWNKEITSVTGNEIYTAQFSSEVNSYTITWVDENDTEISHETLEYGATPSHVDAEKENTAEWTYNFEGWSPAIVDVTGDATYKATFSQTKNSYTITWVDEKGTEILHETLEYGATPSHADAEKENTAEWTYTFTGWTPAITAVTDDATYTATFSAAKNKYAITFVNYDGTTVLQSGEVEYGETPQYQGATPTKPADAQDSYTFTGWSPQITAVTGDATYTAQFSGTKSTYTITFYFGDGVTILSQMELAYGEMPEMTLEPARLADPEFSYTFAGWEPAIAPVTADADYVAVYTATTNSYTIIFRNDDGTELQRDVLDYGILPIYAGEEPTKEEDERYTYEFAGWKPAVDIAKADAVYTATYTATKKKKQDIYDVIESGAQATKIYIEGNIYILRAGHAYAPDGTKLY